MKQIKKDILHSLTASYFQKQKYYPDKKTMLPLDFKMLHRCSLNSMDWAQNLQCMELVLTIERGKYKFKLQRISAKMLSTKIIETYNKKRSIAVFLKKDTSTS
jgi:hypothetical protein